MLMECYLWGISVVFFKVNGVLGTDVGLPLHGGYDGLRWSVGANLRVCPSV